MGYRSDVQIMITKKGFDKLKDYVKEFLEEKKAEGKITNTEEANLLSDLDIYEEHDDYILFGWSSVKWDDLFHTDVMAVMHGLDKLEEAGLVYKFIRLGEETTDIELQEYDNDCTLPYFYVERTICID